MLCTNLARRCRPWLRFSLGQFLLFAILLSLCGALYSHWQPVKRRTSRDLDLAIEGAGYFQLMADNGQTSYTRHGNFHLNENYQMAWKSPQDEEFIIDPPITFPAGSTVRIDCRGQVFAQVPDCITAHHCGMIHLTRFGGPVEMEEVAPGLLQPQIKTVARVESLPGQNGVGWIRHRTLESPPGIRETWPFLAGAAMAAVIAYLFCEILTLRNQVARLKRSLGG